MWVAWAVLGSAIEAIEELRVPRIFGADCVCVAMRVFVVACEQLTAERTRVVNALTALVRRIAWMFASPSLPGRSRRLPGGATVQRTPPRRYAARRPCLARRVRTLGSDLAANRVAVADRLAATERISSVGEVATYLCCFFLRQVAVAFFEAIRRSHAALPSNPAIR